MAKITREPMKVFGSAAGTDQIAQFGSLFAGAPAYSTDPSTIQALSNYLTGWFAAAIGGNSPTIEDMNAICYLFAYQIAYLMQTGVPEWEAGTTYYIGSIVQDGLGNEYVSIADNNTNNATSDATKWKGKGGILPIGTVIASFPNLTGAYNCTATTAADAQGYVKCNGQTIADATSPMNGQVVPNINNSVFLMGSTTAGSTGGSNSTTLTTTQLPAHTHGAGTYATSLSGTFAASSHTHGMAHCHVWGHYQGTGTGVMYGLISANTNTTTITTSDQLVFNTSNPGSIGTASQAFANFAATDLWTTGVASNTGGSGTGNSAVTGNASASTGLSGSNSVTGSSSSAGTGTAYDSRPLFISAVYLMRIK